MREILSISWLWSILAGLCLIQYVFWVPGLFVSLSLVIGVAAVILVVGAGLVQDGILRLVQQQVGASVRALPLRRPRRGLGGILLLGFLVGYIQPQGRLSGYWPLDAVVTLISGAMMIAYGVLDM